MPRYVVHLSNDNKLRVTRTSGDRKLPMRKFELADVHTMVDCPLKNPSTDYVRGMRQFEIYGDELRGVECLRTVKAASLNTPFHQVSKYPKENTQFWVIGPRKNTECGSDGAQEEH